MDLVGCPLLTLNSQIDENRVTNVDAHHDVLLTSAFLVHSRQELVALDKCLVVVHYCTLVVPKQQPRDYCSRCCAFSGKWKRQKRNLGGGH